MSVQGTIRGLTSYAGKDIPGEKRHSVRLLEGLGMEGDFYAQGGDRQLSFLSVEDKQWMNDQTEPGLCFARYKENILFDNIPSDSLIPGSRFTIGEAVLELSSVSKHCYEQCRLFSRGQRCVLAGRCHFAKVIHSGTVSIGDRIEKE